MSAAITLPAPHPSHRVRLFVVGAALVVAAAGTTTLVAVTRTDSSAPTRTPTAESHAHSQIGRQSASGTPDLTYYNGRR